MDCIAFQDVVFRWFIDAADSPTGQLNQPLKMSGEYQKSIHAGTRKRKLWFGQETGDHRPLLTDDCSIKQQCNSLLSASRWRYLQHLLCYAHKSRQLGLVSRVMPQQLQLMTVASGSFFHGHLYAIRIKHCISKSKNSVPKQQIITRSLFTLGSRIGTWDSTTKTVIY